MLEVITTFSRQPSFDVLVYERKDCPLKGDSEATINSLSFEKYLDTLKNTFVECSSKYTSSSSRKQPANAGSEHKQFTENVSVALQQAILIHAYIQNALLFWNTECKSEATSTVHYYDDCKDNKCVNYGRF